MNQLTKERITALVGVVLAAISASPLAKNLAILGKPEFNSVAAGLSLAGFILGFVLALSIFKKTS